MEAYSMVKAPFNAEKWNSSWSSEALVAEGEKMLSAFCCADFRIPQRPAGPVPGAEAAVTPRARAPNGRAARQRQPVGFGGFGGF